MKQFIFLIGVLFCSTSVYAQETPNLITTVLDELNFSKSEINMSRATQQEIKEMPGKSIVVIPKIAELKEKAYIILDAYILLVDSQTGKIKARFVEKRAWTSNAYILYGIEVHPELYNLNEETKAFGIILEYESDSRVNRFGERAFSLFIQKDKKLVRVLKDYPLVSSTVENYSKCNSKYEVHSKTIKIADNKTNKYYDLKVVDNIEKSKTTEENCDPHVVSKSQNVEFLKYRNGKYQKASK